MPGEIVILGVFVADTTYRAERPPRMGETILGNSFALGPGGKGSNQAVAAARAGGNAHFITKLGKDPFADMALSIWQDAGVTPQITQHADSYTGAAYIFVEEASGDNAIIVCPGVARSISPDYIGERRELISNAAVGRSTGRQASFSVVGRLAATVAIAAGNPGASAARRKAIWPPLE